MWRTELYRFVVARVDIYSPRQFKQNIVPCGAGAPVISPGMGGHDAGKGTVIPLRLADILQPYEEGICTIEVQQKLFAR